MTPRTWDSPNRPETPARRDKTPPPLARPSRALYEGAAATAVAAGVFSLIICALLVHNYVRLRMDDPLNSAELSRLKEALRRAPRDEDLKRRIRALDLELRREYFRRERRLDRGRYLLLGGLAVMLVSLQPVLAHRKALPHPRGGPDEHLQQARSTRIARWGVGLLATCLGGGGALLATWQTPPQVAPKPPATVGADYPSPQEILRNWPRFRGPGGLGVSTSKDVPLAWGAGGDARVLWKKPVPLPGDSSPVVWDDRIFLTGATPTRRRVYCFDAETGQLLWERPVSTPAGAGKSPEVMEEGILAASTPVTDGRRVCAIFANGDLACFDYQGKLLWTLGLGIPENLYGHASSLAMYRNLLLVQFDQGSAEEGKSELLAVDVRSGKVAWRARRDVPSSWTTPILIRTARGEQIVTCADPWVIAYDPSNGAELWRAKCLSGDVAPSPAYGGGLVFVAAEGAVLAAIKPDGKGDVTSTHVAWTVEDDLPNIASPATDGRQVYLLSGSMLTCYSAADGRKLYEKDFDSPFRASPTVVGDRLYLLDETGVMIVVATGPTFRQLARSELGEPASATPAFLNGRIYIRGGKHLFCIGKP